MNTPGIADVMELNVEELAAVLRVSEDEMSCIIDDALCQLKESPTAKATLPMDLLAERIEEVRQAVLIGGDVRTLGELANSCDVPHAFLSTMILNSLLTIYPAQRLS